jgi:hypothetical protein
LRVGIYGALPAEHAGAGGVATASSFFSLPHLPVRSAHYRTLPSITVTKVKVHPNELREYMEETHGHAFIKIAVSYWISSAPRNKGLACHGG